MPPLRDDAIRLSDGRRLAYAEWGDPRGATVFLFHGTPLSRLWCPSGTITASAGVRLVTVDRPGVGGSDVLAGRTYADWPRDVGELADALGVGRFGVVGWSAGGAYAAACAALIPERLAGVGIGASPLAKFDSALNPALYEELEPDERRLFELAQHDPQAAAHAAAEVYGERLRTFRDRPETIFDGYEIPEGEREFHEDPEQLRLFFEAVREAVRQGPQAYAWELIDAFLPWGFRLVDIASNVYVWYGEQDTVVERRYIDLLVETLPHAHLTLWPDSGHGPDHHWDDVLNAATA
jgi:pimeloyl-ACP methyl ester carboxylesterase